MGPFKQRRTERSVSAGDYGDLRTRVTGLFGACRGGHVSLPGAGIPPGLLHPNFELVDPAVQRLRREPEDVLSVQLLRAPGEGLAQIGAALRIEVSPSAILQPPLST